jgi:hypothetical protein
LKEVNSVFGVVYTFTRKNGSLYAYNVPLFLSALGVGGYFTFFGKFARGYSMVWLGSGLLPLLTSYIYNNTFQPK